MNTIAKRFDILIHILSAALRFASKNLISREHRHRSVLLISFGIISYLAFQGLDNSWFWGDEAETAFFSKAFLNTGQIQGWDGHNLFTWRNGRLMRENLQSVNPPIMFLVTAASFKLFGVSTYAGRLPHVLIGLLTLIALAFLMKTITRSVPFRLYAFLITGFSVPFLMFIRNVRYYSLCLLASVLALLWYNLLLRKPTVVRAVCFYAACTIMFLSNYLLAVSFVAALLVYHLAFHARTVGYRNHIRILVPAIPFASWALFHSIRYRIWIRLDYVGDPRTVKQFFMRLILNIRDLEQLVTFPTLLGIAALLLSLSLKHNKKLQHIRQLCLFMFAYIVVLSSLSLQTIESFTSYWYADIRYLTPLIPIGAICTAAFCAYIHERAPALAVILFLAVIFTNLLSLRLRDHKPKLLLTEYIREIHHDYRGPFEAAVEYVRMHVPKRDTLAIVPPDYQPSMLFYLTDDYQFLGYLDDSAEVKSAAEKLPTPAFKKDVPNWLVCFGWKHGNAWVKHYSKGKYIFGGPPGARVNRWTVPAYHKDLSRPELPWHSFREITRFDMNADAIYVLKRQN